jgi:hypothetical protein
MGNWIRVTGVYHDYLRKTMWVTPLLIDSVYLFAIGTSLPTDIEEVEKEIKPFEFNLSQNYPNPFNPTTQIKYSIKESGLVTLKIYDLLGREVATLVNEEKPTGTHSVNFSVGSFGGASNLTSGVYFYSITATPNGGQAGTFSQTKKMILLR